MQKFSLGNPQDHDESGRPWYDTKQGVMDSLTSLSDLLRLVGERHTAGYQRKERLNEFHVLGRYWLDTCGNCCKAQGFVPKEEIPDIPDVQTRDEFWEFIKDRKGEDVSISFVHESGLPSPNITCPVCGKGWYISDCHDTVVMHKTDSFSLAEFVGMTLGEVKRLYAQRTDAIYRMQSDILIRNDRFIDPSPKYPNPDSDWQKGIVKNERGWVSEREGIADDYVIQEGDDGFFNIWTYFHGACNRKHLAESEEQQFRTIFEKAGFQTIEMEGISNRYCPCERCAPWFNVRTEFGTITIGWRKRVINIDWSGLSGEVPDILPLFKEEDVTKGATNIHAWGWEKAEDYLSRIRSQLAA